MTVQHRSVLTAFQVTGLLSPLYVSGQSPQGSRLSSPGLVTQAGPAFCGFCVPWTLQGVEGIRKEPSQVLELTDTQSEAVFLWPRLLFHGQVPSQEPLG
jgi:hypothetical protein